MRYGRRVKFSTRLAWRSTLTAAVAIVVGVVLARTALPKLASESDGAKTSLPAGLSRLVVKPVLLPYVPVPALLLGIGSLVLRPLRPVLAPLSALLSILAIAILVATLIAAMMPLYQVSHDMGLGG